MSQAAPSPRSSQPKTPLEETAWVHLDDDVVRRLAEVGEEFEFEPGDTLFDIGEDRQPFIYIYDGCVDITDRLDDSVVVTVESGGFIGELGMLMGGKTFLAAVARESGRALRVPLDKLRALIATPEVQALLRAGEAASMAEGSHTELRAILPRFDD